MASIPPSPTFDLKNSEGGNWTQLDALAVVESLNVCALIACNVVVLWLCFLKFLHSVCSCVCIPCSYIHVVKTHLLLIRLVGSLGSQQPPVLASLSVLLVSDGELAEVTDDVLHLAVVDGALLASKVVEVGDLVEEVVDNGDDDGDTDGVEPDDDNGDNVDLTVGTLDES